MKTLANMLAALRSAAEEKVHRALMQGEVGEEIRALSERITREGARVLDVATQIAGRVDEMWERVEALECLARQEGSAAFEGDIVGAMEPSWRGSVAPPLAAGAEDTYRFDSQVATRVDAFQIVVDPLVSGLHVCDVMVGNESYCYNGGGFPAAALPRIVFRLRAPVDIHRHKFQVRIRNTSQRPRLIRVGIIAKTASVAQTSAEPQVVSLPMARGT